MFQENLPPYSLSIRHFSYSQRSKSYPLLLVAIIKFSPSPFIGHVFKNNYLFVFPNQRISSNSRSNMGNETKMHHRLHDHRQCRQ